MDRGAWWAAVHGLTELHIEHVYVLVCSGSRRVRLFATTWTAAHQAPLSTGFSRQEYWRGLPFPSPGDLTNPGIKPVSPLFPVLAGKFFPTAPPAI